MSYSTSCIVYIEFQTSEQSGTNQTNRKYFNFIKNKGSGPVHRVVDVLPENRYPIF